MSGEMDNGLVSRVFVHFEYLGVWSHRIVSGKAPSRMSSVFHKTLDGHGVSCKRTCLHRPPDSGTTEGILRVLVKGRA